MVSIVRLRVALCYAWCEIFCLRLSTGSFRETKRFPEWCGLLNESLSKLLYLCGLEDMDWAAVSCLFLTLRGGKGEEWSCSLPFPLQGVCASPMLLPHFTWDIICNTIPPIFKYICHKSVTASWYENITGRRQKWYIGLDKMKQVYPASRSCL